MIRLACLFGIIALAVLVLLVTDLSGWTAIYWVFIGFPSLLLALAIYGLQVWRTESLWPRESHDPR
jgi:disulfide bond formation protein DsbB